MLRSAEATKTLELARTAAMNTASLATAAKSTIVMVQTATDQSADWLLNDAIENLEDARLQLDMAMHLLKQHKE